jgi:serine/threonine protein phosphatase 1
MMERILAIGDVHGCNRRLRQLLDRVEIDPRTDALVFVGDYLDRGPDARGTIDTLLDIKATHPNTVFLRGNHESMFLNYYSEGHDEALFLYNGGMSTLDSYGLSLAEARRGSGFPESHLHFLSALPLVYETEQYLFVHAGVRPGIPLAEQAPEDLLWIRHEFIESGEDFGRIVVFGHTPLPEPLISTNKIGIDTGAVYGGRLTCIELPSRIIHQA